MQEKAAFVVHQAAGPRVCKWTRWHASVLVSLVFSSRRGTLELILLEKGKRWRTAVHCKRLTVSRPEKNTRPHQNKQQGGRDPRADGCMWGLAMG